MRRPMNVMTNDLIHMFPANTPETALPMSKKADLKS